MQGTVHDDEASNAEVIERLSVLAEQLAEASVQLTKTVNEMRDGGPKDGKRAANG